jgi:putative transposase
MSKSRHIVRTYKVPVPVGLYGQCSKLNKTAAQIYNETISIIKKTKEEENRWLSIGEVQKHIKDWSKDINIHSHSRQAIVELYFRALDSYFKVVKKDPNRKPPYKEKKTMPFIWKYTAVKLFSNGKLQLSMGRNHEPFEIQTTLPGGTKIREVRLVKESGKYYLHLVIEV